jgi:hypothetical protein
MTAMSPLRQQMTEKLPWLFEDLQFRVVKDFYDPRNFGDCLVTLESDVIRLQFALDRGQILVYLRPLSEPSRWWNIVHVLEAIRGQIPEPRFDLEGKACMLRDNFPALVSALGPGSLDETRREIERYGKERLEAANQQARAARAAARKKSWLDRFFRN